MSRHSVSQRSSMSRSSISRSCDPDNLSIHARTSSHNPCACTMTMSACAPVEHAQTQHPHLPRSVHAWFAKKCSVVEVGVTTQQLVFAPSHAHRPYRGGIVPLDQLDIRRLTAKSRTRLSLLFPPLDRAHQQRPDTRLPCRTGPAVAYHSV
jgi:hypothetical protein